MKSLLLITALAFASTGVQAQSSSERTTTFANGSTFVTSTDVTRNGNTRTVTTSGVGSNGTGYSRTAVWQWNPETKSWQKQVIGETANGRTWSNTGAGSCAAGVCASQSTFTGANGATATRRLWSVRENGARVGRTERTTRRGTVTRDWKRVR